MTFKLLHKDDKDGLGVARDLLRYAKQLDASQFNFSDWVTEFDSENHCGTVCCLVGHLPNMDPEEFWYETIHDTAFVRAGSGLVCYSVLGDHIHLHEAVFLGEWSLIQPEVIERYELVIHDDLSEYSLEDAIHNLDAAIKIIERKEDYEVDDDPR